MCHKCPVHERNPSAPKHWPPAGIKIAGIKIAYISFNRCKGAKAAELVSVESRLFHFCEFIDDVEHQQRTVRPRSLCPLAIQVEQTGELS